MSTMYDIMKADGAKEFLDEIAINSESSKSSFAVALSHFQNFLDTKQHTLQNILKPLATNEMDVYKLLNEFKNHMLKQKNGNDESMAISFKSIKAYMAGVRSFLQYHDIDIVPAKFKRKVKMPKIIRQDEEAIDAPDIREILLHTSNRRLKSYDLGLASGGMRTIELASTRICDFKPEENRIDIRGESTKTKQARFTFISDEAVKFLNEWIAWKYRSRRKTGPRHKTDEDLIFAVNSNETDPHNIYEKMRLEFNKVLTAVKKDKRKDGAQRRKITMNSLRRFAKTTVADQVNTDYSEWLIGHAKSSYWTKKPEEKLEIYKSKCMQHLTFLDYTTLEATGKNIETKLEQKDKQISDLRQELYETDEGLRSQVELLSKQIQEMQKKLESHT